MLHAEVEGSGPPVVLVHGFTQSASAWGPIARRLATGHMVISLDAPGHGRSAGVQAGLAEGADLMARRASQLGAGAAAWIGYSMGGRFALHVALRHPRAVSRLALVSATAGIDDPAERRRRQESDAARARRVEEIGVEAFVAEWLSQPLFATLPPEAAAVESRLGGTAAGLVSSLHLAGTGSQEPLWNRLGELRMPVLAVAGACDIRYVALARRLVETIGAGARLCVIDGAGHACHLERPEAFLRAVVPFLQGSDP